MTVASLFDQLVDQYKLEEHIAQKTFTDAYLAYDVDEKRNVRVEIMQPRYVEDADFARAFLERATALSRVRHPNLVRTLQSGTAEPDRPYFAADVVEGYPLSERLAQLARQKSPVHSVYALKLVRQIAEAVQFAERLDLYHCALTPDNILLKSMTLRSNDTVLVDNFVIPAKHSYTDATSRPYLSPEQLDGKEITGRSMVYSLGAMLHHLLSGAAPTGPVGWWEQTSSTISGKSRLQSIREDLSPELYRLVDRALRANPARRYRSTSEFIAAVDEAIAAEELRIHSEDVAATSRRPWAFLLAAVFAILLCFAGIWIAWQVLPGQDNGSAIAAAGITSESDLSGGVVSDPTQTPTAVPSATPEPTTTGTTAVDTAPTAEASATPTLEATPTATQTPSPTPTLTPEPTATAQPVFRVVVASAAMRAGPGTIYPGLGYLFEGDEVTIIGRNDAEAVWYNVISASNERGWVSESVGELLDAGANIPVAPTIPAAPTRTPTPTPTSTPEPTDTPPSAGGGDNGGGDGGDNGGGGPPPDPPTPTPPF